MSSFLRSSTSLVLLLAAVATALAGVSAQWLDRLARTPEPMQEIMAPLATDERVHEAIADAMTESAAEQFPVIAEAFPDLESRLNALVQEAVTRTLAGAGVAEAWDESVDLSRTALVDELDALDGSDAEAPTVWLYLDPFVELAREQLVALAPEPLEALVEQLEPPGDLRIALGRPDADRALQAAVALRLAGWWPWCYAAAALLAAAGLAIGSRRGRWLALLLATALGTLALMAARVTVGFIDAPAGSSVARAVGATVWEGTVDSLVAWTWPVVLTGWVLVAVAVAGLIVTVAQRR